jgi:membrane protein required for colicin V production
MFNLIVLIVLVVSGLIGWARGATREIMTVLAFLLAAMFAVATLGFTAPIARATIHPDWIANPIALILVFIVAYVALRIAGGVLVHRVRTAEHLGALDRAVGLGFGVIRALVLLGAFNIILNLATREERMPHWISGAFLYPLTSVSAQILKEFVPEGRAMAGRVSPVIEKAVTGSSESKGDKTPQEGANGTQQPAPARQLENSR